MTTLKTGSVFFFRYTMALFFFFFNEICIHLQQSRYLNPILGTLCIPWMEHQSITKRTHTFRSWGYLAQPVHLKGCVFGNCEETTEQGGNPHGHRDTVLWYQNQTRDTRAMREQLYCCTTMPPSNKHLIKHLNLGCTCSTFRYTTHCSTYRYATH